MLDEKHTSLYNSFMVLILSQLTIANGNLTQYHIFNPKYKKSQTNSLFCKNDTTTTK